MKQAKRILAALLVLCTLAAFVAMPAAAYDFNDYGADQNGHANLTVTGAKEGDQFRVWMVVGIAYDEDSNALTYSFTNAANNYFSGKNVTIEDFMANYESNSGTLNTLLAGLPQHIHDNGNGDGADGSLWKSPWGGVQTADANGSFTVANCKAGGYFIEPISSTSVYRPMFCAIVPTVDEETAKYTYSDQTITAKHADVSIEKLVKNISANSFTDAVNASTTSIDPAAISSQVEFEVTIGVPKYLTGANRTTMKIVDALPSGLSLVTDPESIHVFALQASTSSGEELDSTYYTLATGNNTLTVDFSDKYSQLPSCQFIRVTYKANVTEAAPVAAKNGDSFAAVENTASYTYTCYPYVNIGNTEKTITDTAKVYTYGLTIDKYGVNNNNSTDFSTKLANAKFKLYRPAESEDGSDVLEQIEGVTGNVVEIAKGLTIQTDADGAFNIPGLKDGTYYLVEIAAPSGYKLDDTAKEVTVATGTETGYSIAHIGNSAANLSLPTTGSTGMVVFTVVGIAVMGAAVIVLVLASKKKKV